jgi:hypothetical protein
MYVAVALLMLVAIACGSPEPVEPTPTPDVPMFAEGEAAALVEAVVFAKYSASGGARTACEPLVQAIHGLIFGTTTASYLGQQVWSVVQDTMLESGTMTLEWKVFEFSGVVQGTNEEAEVAMMCSRR